MKKVLGGNIAEYKSRLGTESSLILLATIFGFLINLLSNAFYDLILTGFNLKIAIILVVSFIYFLVLVHVLRFMIRNFEWIVEDRSFDFVFKQYLVSITKFNSGKQTYQGTLVEESLEDNRILNDFNIISVRITNDENLLNRWHLYKVESVKDKFLHLSRNIKEGSWYAHFWDEDKNIITVFRGKVFEFNYNDKSSWAPAVEYGKSLGIPDKQLDFVIE